MDPSNQLPLNNSSTEKKNRPLISVPADLPTPAIDQPFPLILPFDPRRLTPGVEVILCQSAKPLGIARLICQDQPCRFDNLPDSAFLWIESHHKGEELRETIRQHFDRKTDLQTRLFAVHVFQ